MMTTKVVIDPWEIAFEETGDSYRVVLRPDPLMQHALGPQTLGYLTPRESTKHYVFLSRSGSLVLEAHEARAIADKLDELNGER